MSTAPPPRGAVVAAVLAGLAAVLALLASAPPAAAHEELLSSDPSESGVVETLPSRAILTFTGAVSEVHEVTVTGPDGSVANGEATSVGAEVRQNLWAGPDGDYTLTYDVLSSDGHEIAGEIHFEVGDGTPAAGDEEAAARASSSSDGAPDGALRGVVVPSAVVLVSGACALVLWHRRRATG
jgi:methionine-rich copper-binding protein CopC